METGLQTVNQPRKPSEWAERKDMVPGERRKRADVLQMEAAAV